MINIRIHKCDGVGELPGDDDYQIVIARQVDDQGEWLTRDVQSFRTLPQLKAGLVELMADADGVVIEASAQFGPLAQELGLSLLRAERKVVRPTTFFTDVRYVRYVWMGVVRESQFSGLPPCKSPHPSIPIDFKEASQNLEWGEK